MVNTASREPRVVSLNAFLTEFTANSEAITLSFNTEPVHYSFPRLPVYIYSFTNKGNHFNNREIDALISN